MGRDRHAVVILAFRHQRPAVIPAWHDQVELVPAARTHLGLPQPPLSVEGQAVGVAMAGGPGLSGRQVWPRPFHLPAGSTLRCFGVARRVGDGYSWRAWAAGPGIAGRGL